MTDKPVFHENLNGHDDVKVGTERSFGLVFAVVFIVVALWPLLISSDPDAGLRIWSLIIAGIFAVSALTVPKVLAPLNRLWFKFGLLLHKIVNPLVMALLYFVTVTPFVLL